MLDYVGTELLKKLYFHVRIAEIALGRRFTPCAQKITSSSIQGKLEDDGFTAYEVTSNIFQPTQRTVMLHVDGKRYGAGYLSETQIIVVWKDEKLFRTKLMARIGSGYGNWNDIDYFDARSSFGELPPFGY